MELVETRAALEQVAGELTAARVFYLDTEFASTRQGTELCLLQLSEGTTTYVVDPLRLRDLSVLGAPLSGPDVEWVLHGGQQDLPLLLRHLALKSPPRLFDTQIAWGLLSAEPAVALAYLVYRVLGERAPKTHQSDDWKRRPLPRAQLEYAATDIAHLPALRRELGRRAVELGRGEHVAAASHELLCPIPEPPAPLSLASFRHAWQLDPPSQAALRELIEWHNGLDEAARAQAPEPRVLLALAARMPETGEELGRIKGVPRSWAARYGDHLSGRMMRASAEARAADFVPIEPEPYATFEDLELDAELGLVRARTCARVSVAPELGLPQRVLRSVRAAWRETRDPVAARSALSGWRRELLGDALHAELQALR